MNFFNIDHQKYNNFILKIYILNNKEYIEKSDLNELYKLISNSIYRLKIDILNSIEEQFIIKNKLHNFINITTFKNLIKNKKINTMTNTILYLIQNVKRITIYPNNDFEIEKFKDEIKKLKIEINDLKKIKKDITDLKSIINYINNKINIYINNTRSATNIDINEIEINCQSEHIMRFPILNSN